MRKPAHESAELERRAAAAGTDVKTMEQVVRV
jgi:hypothetical protein